MSSDLVLQSLGGGALIGLAASALLLLDGRVAGVSSIVAGLPGGRADAWRWLFVLGLLGGGSVVAVVAPQAFADELGRSPGTVAVAGVLVGVGTRLAGGCTSGHGVCGVSRGAPRSLVATGVFMATGIATTAFLARVLA